MLLKDVSEIQRVILLSGRYISVVHYLLQRTGIPVVYQVAFTKVCLRRCGPSFSPWITVHSNELCTSALATTRDS